MSASTTWIHFKKLRSGLNFTDVLEHFQVKVKMRGDRATGFCPLPTHLGDRKSPSFSANLQRGIWQCFGCHAKGNTLDFASRMLGFNPDNSQELRKAAIKIQNLFGINGTPPLQDKPITPKPSPPSSNVLINEPIDFELKTLDPAHPYLLERGYSDTTIAHFGLGFCNRGMLKNRVAIPLHDARGRLVGYAGRITRDEMISDKCPKYLFPGERERNGTTFQFHKSLVLYNAHQINAPVDHLFVVEGFTGVWWLWQSEYRNTVAVMGSSCSVEQANLIVNLVKPDGKVWLMPDGDEAGVQCAKSVLELVSPHRFVRWVRLTDNEQPTDFLVDELIALFGE